MGQAGAQREPSMEEILASIRRIIENNEPGPTESDDAYVPHQADEARIDADYAEQEAESQRTAANDASVAQPVSLADVAARARATPDSHSPKKRQNSLLRPNSLLRTSSLRRRFLCAKRTLSTSPPKSCARL